MQFFEDFVTDARARFDWRLQTTVEPPQNTFQGEHDMACAGPTTYRTVRQPVLTWGQPHSNVDVTNSELVWWCAPGNDPAKGHMMTGLDTESVATLSFTPKQTFSNVSTICWDQNMNNLGEGKWINVYVVPAGSYSGDPAYVDGLFVGQGGIPQRLPVGAYNFDWVRGTSHVFTIDGGGNYLERMEAWKSSFPDGMATESASRFTICLLDGGRRVTLERPNGTTDSYPTNAVFPTGAVQVIFQDASYNPVKHNGSSDHLTWHWDNISIS